MKRARKHLNIVFKFGNSSRADQFRPTRDVREVKPCAADHTGGRRNAWCICWKHDLLLAVVCTLFVLLSGAWLSRRISSAEQQDFSVKAERNKFEAHCTERLSLYRISSVQFRRRELYDYVVPRGYSTSVPVTMVGGRLPLAYHEAPQERSSKY